MKKLFAMVLCVCLMLTVCASAEGMAGMSGAMPAAGDLSQIMAEALTGPSEEFSLANAWLCLASFCQQDAKAAAASMEQLGLSVLLQANYGKPVSDHSHTCGYTLATGMLPVRGEIRTVAAMGIRGTADGEWYSNVDFAGETGGNCAYAENFMAAAQDVYDGILPELEKLDDPVILVSGYSRGAACANLLGVLLDDEFGTEDIYVYTFAAPNTVHGQKEGYGNVFNLVNVNDAIPRMPLREMGFTRAGVDIELRDEAVINTPMHQMFLSMLGICPEIDDYYSEKHSLTEPGLSDDGVTLFEIMTAMADLLSGDNAAKAAAQQLYADALAAPNDFSDFLPRLTAMLQSADGSPIPPLFAQHLPQVYLQLMMNLGDDK